MSKLKIILKYLTGGFSGVVDYALDFLNKAVAGIDPAKKEKVQHALNIAKQVAAVLEQFAWLCPAKWQTAYGKTIAAVVSVTAALDDLTLTADELKQVTSDFAAAVAAWNAPDDETCV